MRTQHSFGRAARALVRLRTKWILIAAAVLLALAISGNPSVLAKRLYQGTVPPPTPFPTNTPISTSTPTNTPVPTATNTPRPGETPPPTATNTPTPLPSTPTATPEPEVALDLALNAPSTAVQGEQVELIYVVSNPTDTTARNVRIRNLLPASLILISAEAAGDGEAILETEAGGGTVVLFSWVSLAPGEQRQGRILAEVAPEVRNGVVIDNLAVAFADNACGSTTGVSIGLPPAILPFFN